MDWITTSTVLASLRDFENHVAWGQFVSRFREPVRRFARSIGLPESEADDVAQETLAAFAESYRGGHYDRDKGRLSQWLFGIAYRKAQDERRRAARRSAAPASSAILNQLADVDAPGLVASWDEEWEQALLKQCLAQVRNEVEPVTYQAFEMVVRQERDTAEAAEALGVNVKVIYNAKHRVLKRIRELREQYETVH